MLNKEVCKRCIEAYEGSWCYLDEEDWDNGKVFCPPSFTSETFWKIDKGPSSKCPYALEHVVSCFDLGSQNV